MDVIVGGHSNTLLSNTNDCVEGVYPTMFGDTAIVQAYAYCKFLGKLNVTFDGAGRISMKQSNAGPFGTESSAL